MNNKSLLSKKILVTTDFSEASYKAFPYALEHCKGKEDLLTLVNVFFGPAIPIGFSEYLPTPQDIEALKKEAHTHLEKKLKEVVNKYFEKLPVHTVVLEHYGWAADVIVEYAKKENIGLIVVGSHGHGMLERFMLGSVAESILRQAHCPVLVVPTRHETMLQHAAHLPYRNILVTTDFSVQSRIAVPIAIEESRRTEAKLTVGYVIETPISPELLEMKIISTEKAQGLQAAYREKLKKNLQEYVASIDKENVSCALIDKTYSVSNSIVKYIENNNVDLIVVSTKGSGNRQIWIGGVAEKIVRHCPCPVLLVPSTNK